MLQAYPKIDTTFQIVDLDEYATHTDVFCNSSAKITYTNPRRLLKLHLELTNSEVQDVNYDRRFELSIQPVRTISTLGYAIPRLSDAVTGSGGNLAAVHFFVGAVGIIMLVATRAHSVL